MTTHGKCFAGKFGIASVDYLFAMKAAAARQETDGEDLRFLATELGLGSAREALEHARFDPKPDVHVRFGTSYRMPFVFRIAGAARLKESGVRPRSLWAPLHAAHRAAQRLRRA